MLLQQCHPNLAGSLVIARGTEMGSPLFLLFFCVVGYPPNWGKWPRYIDRLGNRTANTNNQTCNNRRQGITLRPCLVHLHV